MSDAVGTHPDNRQSVAQFLREGHTSPPKGSVEKLEEKHSIGKINDLPNMSGKRRDRPELWSDRRKAQI